MPHRIFLALIASLIPACGPTPIPTRTVAPPIRVVSTLSAQPLLKAATDRTAFPGIVFEVTMTASLSDLANQVANGAVGITLYLPPDSTLWGTPLGEEPLAVVVNPADTTHEMTLAQVQDVFAGRAGGWTVAIREEGDDSRAAFESLTATKPTLNAVVTPTPEAMNKFVANTPNSIGYLPLHWATGAVKALMIEGRAPTASDYALKASVVAVATAEPTGPARDWLGELQSQVR